MQDDYVPANPRILRSKASTYQQRTVSPPDVVRLKKRTFDEGAHCTLPETVYGTRKRLNLILQVLAEYETIHGADAEPLCVLDVGCGTGALLTFPIASAGYWVVGIDVDERSVRCYADRKPKEASLIVGDVLSLSDKPLFNMIICSEVLEHLADPLPVLRKCRRLMRPGGLLIVTVPNGYGSFEWEELLWNRLGFFVLDRIKQYYQAVRLRIRRRQFRQFFQRGLNVDLEDRSLFNTLNHSPHLQFFTFNKIRKLLSSVGFEMTFAGNLSFLSGKITHTLFGSLPEFVKWTTRVGDRLPLCLCSNWLLVCNMHVSETGVNDSERDKSKSDVEPISEN